MHRALAALKDPVSGLTHLASAAAAVVGFLFLLHIGPPSLEHRAAFAVYGISLILLFSASAAYHLIRGNPAVDGFLRRLDHSAIFLLIAGTYTPFCVIVLPGALGTVILVIVWALAGAGILMHVAFLEKIPTWISTALYVAMGWLGIIAVVPLVRTLSREGLFLLLAGGLLYSGGAVIYALKKPNPLPGVFGSHEIWHLFVSAGALSHFILMAGIVATF
ncbi:MAG: hemolysin III family protein [Spirochaetia bacterium]|jgi:hemolysin III